MRATTAYERAQTTPLPDAELRRLVKLAQGGDTEARNQVILANTRWRFVVSQRILRRFRDHVVSVEDLAHYAIFGEMHAIKRYDHRPDTTYIAYASWWIKQAVIVGLEQTGRTVRVPQGVLRSGLQIKRYLERTDTTEDEWEIAKRLGIKRSMYKNVVQSRRVTWSLAQASSPSGHMGDINEPTVDGGQHTVEDAEQIDLLREAIASLTGREREVVERRMAGETLISIGESLGIVREYVRIIQNRAHIKIRAYMTHPKEHA